MTTTRKKRLAVVTETLRTLWSGALAVVHGGNAGTSPSEACSRICSIGRDCDFRNDPNGGEE
jgi:hypothetical protein